jgi:hypothetical protein
MVCVLSARKVYKMGSLCCLDTALQSNDTTSQSNVTTSQSNTKPQRNDTASQSSMVSRGGCRIDTINLEGAFIVVSLTSGEKMWLRPNKKCTDLYIVVDFLFRLKGMDLVPLVDALGSVYDLKFSTFSLLSQLRYL